MTYLTAASTIFTFLESRERFVVPIASLQHHRKDNILTEECKKSICQYCRHDFLITYTDDPDMIRLQIIFLNACAAQATSRCNASSTTTDIKSTFHENGVHR